MLCGITGLCIADKRSQHLANSQQLDDKTLSSIDDEALASSCRGLKLDNLYCHKSALSSQEGVLGTPEIENNNQTQTKVLF